MIDRMKAVEAQTRFCEENEVPMFAPGDGYCEHCMNDIYAIITVEEAGKRLITGCPHCNHSFVD